MLFASNAYADAVAQAEPSPLFTFIMFGGLFVFMYFIMIRPQQNVKKSTIILLVHCLRVMRSL